MAVVEGKIAFENLDTHEMYQGQSTGKYSVVISVSDSVADDLAAKGVKMREYEGTRQRKFSSKYDIPVVDVDGHPFTGASVGDQLSDFYGLRANHIRYTARLLI